jgi:ketosteroid isomerase-like protein
MKVINLLIIATCLLSGCSTSPAGVSESYRQSLLKTTAAIRDAFARGDVAALMALHHPNVVKYFGGDNVVKGRAALGRGMAGTFKNVKMQFVENRIESTVFNGETAIETSIFTIKVIPKNGGQPTFARGRSMVVYVRYKDSPYGWVSLREMAQAAPDEKQH